MNQLKKGGNRLIHFCQRHFALKMAVPMGALVLVVAVIFQSYLKRQYYQFLYQEVYRTDQVSLSTQESIVSDRIYTMVRLGSMFATSEDLYRNVADTQMNSDEERTLHVTAVLAGLSAYDNSMAVMAVVTENGDVFQYSRRNLTGYMKKFWNADNEEQLEVFYTRLGEKIDEKLIHRVEACYVMSTEVKEEGGRSRYLLHMAFPVIGQEKSFSKSAGMLLVTFELDMLEDFLSRVEGMEREYTYGFVSDTDGAIIYHEDPKKVGMDADIYLSETESTSMQTFVEQTGWKLYMVIDEEGIQHHVNEVYQKSIWLYLFVLILLVFFILFIYVYTLQPIKTISIALNNVRDGELNQKIPVHGEDEICRLAMQYNQMTDSLKEQREQTRKAYDKNIESLKRANEAEREALESQINAHFLCNTLSAFNYSAIQAGNEELSVMLRRLSNILRYTFSGSFQEVTVAQEIMWVEQYLYLQKYRLGDVFDYDIRYSEEYDAWPCCKLFIQPFVENSISHGFQGREKGGFISIDCGLYGDRLRCVISDNGCGIPKKKVEKLQEMLQSDTMIERQGIGIGIQNVTTRLRMFYGERFDIVLQSEYGEGTQFILYLPIPEEMSEEEEEEWL